MQYHNRRNSKARAPKLAPWQKQRKQIEERERVARVSPEYFNYKLNRL